jgi:regulatory protein
MIKIEYLFSPDVFSGLFLPDVLSVRSQFYSGLFARSSLLLLSSVILLSVAFKRGRPIEDEAALYDYAVGALGRRMRSVAELKRLLRQRVPQGEIGTLLVDMVILRLKEQKYLNDSSYAAAYTSFRKENEKFGPRRVITDLKVKGVHGDVIEKAVGEAYAGVDEQEQARAFLRRKRLKEPQNEKDAVRVFRSLMRAGFSAGVIIKILKNWNVDEEMLSALQHQDEGSNTPRED